MKTYLTLLATLMVNQIILAQLPVISSFSPASGPVGATVIIAGTNFNSTPANNKVFFGAVRASVNTASATSLSVTVPAGATFQPITVTVNNLTAFAAKPFMVTFAGAGTGFTASSFAPKIDYSSGKGPSCIAAGDFDGDGKPDLAVVNDSANTVSVFRNISSGAAISFSLKIDYGTGNTPYSIVAGDLDGDGKQDLAVANGSANTLSIFRNTSTGTGNISFAPKTDLISGAYPLCVIIKDFDRDGKPDLASANSSSNTVSIFKNGSSPGVLSFSLKTDFATGAAPFWLAAGDLDNDGKPEIASANGNTANSVSVLRNTSIPGTISFAPKTDFDGGGYSNSIAMGDLDGDGKTDLAMGNGPAPSVAILLNRSSGTGNISFAQRLSFAAGNGSFGITLSDMDGDSRPDIIAANSNANDISVLRNEGVGNSLNFELHKDFVVGSNPWVSVAVDLDGDGKPEIATANQRTANMSVLKNVVSTLGIQSFSPTFAGSGTSVMIGGKGFVGVTGVSFGGIPAASFTVLSSTSISAVVGAGATGNLVITTNSATASLAGFTWLIAPSVESFVPDTAGTGDTVTITGTDFTGITAVSFGGIPAAQFFVLSSTKIAAVVGEGASGRVAVMSPGGIDSLNGFTYIPPPLITSFTPANADTGSIVIISGAHFTGAISVKFGEKAARSFTVISPNTISAVVGSFTGGVVEVTTPFGSAKLEGFYNGHSITSFTPVSGPVGSIVTINGINFSSNPLNNIVLFGATRAVVVHATKNVLTVVVPAGSTFQPISVICNQLIAFSDKPFVQTFLSTDSLFTINSFANKIDFASGKDPNGVSAGDLDGDGKPDLVVANYGDGTVSVYKNTATGGTITFTKTDLPVSSANNVFVSDLDGDGKPEIIATNYTPFFSVFKNNSNPSGMSFSSPVQFPMEGDSYYRPSVNDIDGDGKPDIVMTNSTNSQVLISRNTTNGVISFAPAEIYPTGIQPQATFLSDLDGDKKPDLLVSNFNSDKISVYRNVSTYGVILFENPVDIIAPSGLGTIIAVDFDGDDKPDMVVSNKVDNTVVVYRNTSSVGNISFDLPGSFLAGINIYDFAVQDLNGDGKPDIAGVSINSAKLSLLKNTSTGSSISFAPKVEFETGTDPISIISCDLNGDGKADLAVANFHSNTLSVYRNRIGEVNPVLLCPPMANGLILSNLTGTNYQWQVNTGSGFVSIANNINYSGAVTARLQLTSIPSSWYGYKYRCVVDGLYSDVFEIRFSDSWTGAVNNTWENPSNWSCGTVPDSKTDVVINSGTVVINSNVTIRSLKENAGATITVNAGFHLAILH